MLLRPACILVLLLVLCRIFLPAFRRFASLDGIVLVAVVALLGHRDNRRINHLPAARNKALGVEMVIELVKQIPDHLGLGELFTKQPDRRGIRHRRLDAETQKTHKRKPVAHLIFELFVGQIVELRQDQHLEFQDGIVGLAPGVGLALIAVRTNRRLDLEPETLLRHSRIDNFQRIALLRQRVQTLIMTITSIDLLNQICAKRRRCIIRGARKAILAYFARREKY